MSECKCTFAQKTVGDGCEVCNPAYALQFAKEQIAELRAEVERKQTLLDDAKAVMERQIARRHELEAQVLALQSCQKAWQPIENAPAGTMSLFCSMKTDDVSKWCFVDWLAGGQFMLHPKWTATHWMPLPAAPSQPLTGEPT